MTASVYCASQESQLTSLRLKLSLLTGDVQTGEKQTFEARIAELAGDVEEKKKSAGTLSSLLKEAEVARIAAATSCFPSMNASPRPLPLFARQNDIRGLRSKTETSESRRRGLSNTVEELMLICDAGEKELNKLVGVEQVSPPPETR